MLALSARPPPRRRCGDSLSPASFLLSTAAYALDPIRAELGAQLHAALSALKGAPFSLDAEALGRLVEQPPDATLGDYALPCFRFAKELGQKPADIAQKLADTLPRAGILRSAAVASAFLNLTLDGGRLAEIALAPIVAGTAFTRLGAAEKRRATRLMVEYSQPNTHKEFHVGHARNVCLGQSLVRLFRYCGYDVVGANYYGDEGTHIATVLWQIQRSGETAPATGRGEWLGKKYVEGKRALAALDGEALAQATAEISAIHRAIEAKQGEAYQLWRTTRQWSLDDFDAIYAWLNVSFDVLFYESEESAPAQAIVDEFLAKGVFILDQGAVGVDLKEQKLGFCILRKRDGNTLYATKDLALARRKFEQYKIDRSIYVVADEQAHHFKQVFKVLQLMGFAQAAACHHLSYGLVVLPEGKMSSRDGTAVTFGSLRAEISSHLAGILAKYEGDWSAAEIADTTHRLADGAIKYGMLSTDPDRKIVYNLADWVAFDGNSGPYLMYSYSRTRSILRKAEEAGAKPSAAAARELTQPTERELLRALFEFDNVVAVAAEGYRPSHLATHLFHMCKSFNRFYADVPVLKAERPELRDARLALIGAFAATLETGLGLLGIRPPERM
jgi:arginyl-tRNA synthetase